MRNYMLGIVTVLALAVLTGAVEKDRKYKTPDEMSAAIVALEEQAAKMEGRFRVIAAQLRETEKNDHRQWKEHAREVLERLDQHEKDIKRALMTPEERKAADDAEWEEAENADDE